MKILVSACLMGLNCRYNGIGVVAEGIRELMKEHQLIPVCPEIFGGMPTPRDPAEQRDNRVFTSAGEDVTEPYTKGAEEVVRLAKLYGCTLAILKERSPSCGYGTIYDGSFSHTRIDGNGVTAGRLAEEGLRIIGESRIEELIKGCL